MDLPLTLGELQLRYNAGESFRFLPFWGDKPRQAGVVDESCLSQWYHSPFQVDGVRYATAEHYMMAAKARLFGDQQILAEILASSDPAEAKGLGRRVRGFTDEHWNRQRLALVIAGNRAKFSQHPPLAQWLVATAPMVLVEASPIDRIWGIGRAPDDPRVANPNLWAGLNLLGFALGTVRSGLRNE